MEQYETGYSHILYFNIFYITRSYLNDKKILVPTLVPKLNGLELLRCPQKPYNWMCMPLL